MNLPHVKVLSTFLRESAVAKHLSTHLRSQLYSPRSIASTCFCPNLLTYGIKSAIKSEFVFNFGTDLIERTEFPLPRWLKVFRVQWLAVGMSPKQRCLLIWIQH